MVPRIALAALLLLPGWSAMAETGLEKISLEVSPPQKHSVSGSVANIYIGNYSLHTEPRIKISCAALGREKQVIETKNTFAQNVFPGQVAYSNVHFDAASEKIASISCTAANAAE